MELDDLKAGWKATTDSAGKKHNIATIISGKSSGPVFQLKRTFRKNAFALLTAMVLLIYNLSRHHSIFNDVLFWCYILFCAILTAFFIYGYRTTSKLQTADLSVESNLRIRIALLEKQLRIRLAVVRIMPVIFLTLMEILMYYHQEPSLKKWYAVHPSLRFAAYLSFIIFFYFFSKFMLMQRYGKHAERLKQLANELE